MEIENNLKLQNQIQAVTELYQRWKYHPRFSIPEFIEILNRCSAKVQNKSAFKSYFQKALQNQWGQPRSSTTAVDQPKRSSDLPPWIVRQEELARSGQKPEEEKISPEEQAKIDEMMRQLDLL